MKIVSILSLFALISNIDSSHEFDVIALPVGLDSRGTAAAFGYYNDDKLVDVFVISPSGI